MELGDGQSRWWGALRRFPAKTLVAVTLLCLVLREEFPFSHFPMYSSFEDWTYYVYVTDKSGAPVPLETVTSVRVAKLKKVFQSELDALKDQVRAAGGDWPGFGGLALEQRRPAGEAALAWLEGVWKEGARPGYGELAPVTFHQVTVEMVDREMTRRDEEVATR
jgi:hypothetical protein